MVRSGWLLLVQDFIAWSVITEPVHLRILICRSQASGKLRLRVAKKKD